MNAHCIIMAGGSGTRFWPESRKSHPKQLIALVNTKSLLEETIERVLPVFTSSKIHIVTGKDIKDKVIEYTSIYKDINIIAEPKGRNTAPCIGYMAFRISHFYSPDDVMIILPSDHLIKNNERFLETINAGIETATEYNCVVTVGIEPLSPHTGYGYIEMGKKFKTTGNINIHTVKSFKEKPDIEKAKSFIEAGNYLWNAGIFITKADVIVSAIKEYMPELHTGLSEIAKAFDTKDEDKVFTGLFPSLPFESIDFGVIEKLSNVLAIPSDFGWNDLGCWTSLEDFKKKTDLGISNTENIVAIDSENLIINVRDNRKLISLLNVKDLIVIDTDDVLLIANKKDAQRVKELTEKLKKNGLEKYV